MPNLQAPNPEFAIRLSSIDQLFWDFDASPVAERTLSGDARWYLLDEWERVRHAEPSYLIIYSPESDRESTDEDAVRTAIRTSLRKSSGALRRIDPLSRQEKVAAWIGIAFLVICVMASTAIDRLSDALLIAADITGHRRRWLGGGLGPGRALHRRGGPARVQPAALRRVRRHRRALRLGLRARRVR